jgi:hypothetical protein
MRTDRTINVEIEDYLLYDALHDLAIEYATSIDHLVNTAIRRMVSDIEFARELRTGNFKAKAAHRSGERT